MKLEKIYDDFFVLKFRVLDDDVKNFYTYYKVTEEHNIISIKCIDNIITLNDIQPNSTYIINSNYKLIIDDLPEFYLIEDKIYSLIKRGYYYENKFMYHNNNGPALCEVKQNSYYINNVLTYKYKYYDLNKNIIKSIRNIFGCIKNSYYESGSIKKVTYYYNNYNNIKSKTLYDNKGNLSLVNYYNINFRLHNDAGPACIKYYHNNIKSIEFYINGNKEGYSYEYNIHGILVFQKHFKNDKLHDSDKYPAYIEYFPNKSYKKIKYYNNDLNECTFGPACINYDFNGNITKLKYKKNNKKHNTSGPAVQVFKTENNIHYLYKEKFYIDNNYKQIMSFDYTYTGELVENPIVIYYNIQRQKVNIKSYTQKKTYLSLTDRMKYTSIFNSSRNPLLNYRNISDDSPEGHESHEGPENNNGPEGHESDNIYTYCDDNEDRDEYTYCIDKYRDNNDDSRGVSESKSDYILTNYMPTTNTYKSEINELFKNEDEYDIINYIEDDYI